MADGDRSMNRVFRVPAEAHHFAAVAIAMREDERDQWKAWQDRAEYNPSACYYDMVAQGEAAWALVNERGIAFYVGGFSNLRPGVWQTWAAGTQAGWDAHWKAITRHSRRAILQVLASGRAHRIEICSLASRVEAGRWYASLGLRPEGCHARYFADGRDAVCYAITKEPTP